jgi:hypothetical protein
MSNIGQTNANTTLRKSDISERNDSFVLEKGIFSKIFEKDIRRVYLYKKSERLAKALHLVSPALKNSPQLRVRLERVAVELIDAASGDPMESRNALSRELLALSSVLSIAQVAGHLSPMNADIISREAHLLLGEIASYEEPKITLEEVPTLASLSKQTPSVGEQVRVRTTAKTLPRSPYRDASSTSIGHKRMSYTKNDRSVSILSVLKNRGPSYIKDISMVVREVSEKTIQRELQQLVLSGKVKKTGERRWTVYEFVSDN